MSLVFLKRTQNCLELSRTLCNHQGRSRTPQSRPIQIDCLGNCMIPNHSKSNFLGREKWIKSNRINFVQLVRLQLQSDMYVTHRLSYIMMKFVNDESQVMIRNLWVVIGISESETYGTYGTSSSQWSLQSLVPVYHQHYTLNIMSHVFKKVTFSQQNMTTSPFVSFCLLPNNFSRKPRPSGRASTQSTRSMAEL